MHFLIMIGELLHRSVNRPLGFKDIREGVTLRKLRVESLIRNQPPLWHVLGNLMAADSL